MTLQSQLCSADGNSWTGIQLRVIYCQHAYLLEECATCPEESANILYILPSWVSGAFPQSQIC